MAAVLWALFKLDPRAHYWICVGTGVSTGLSGLIYLFVFMRLLAKHPSSSPTKRGDANSTNERE